MSLLTIVQDVRLRLNQSRPTTVFANTDTAIQQMVALLQDIGDELAERNYWQSLNIPSQIVGDGTSTTFPLPSAAVGSAFDGGYDAGFGGGDVTPSFAMFSPGLKFQSTRYPMMPITGPVTNEQMAALKAFPVAPIQPVWRIIENYIEFYPALSAGEILKYNFYSSNWIVSGVTEAGSPPWVPRWTSDADTSLIDEKVLSRGLEWRWLATKGLDYAEAFRRYELSLARADGRQATRREVNMSRKPMNNDTIWPGVIPIYDQLTG